MCVAKYWDDLWLGVKGQSNLDIAGFPRNIFRYSVEDIFKWNRGRALVVLGGAQASTNYKETPNTDANNSAVRLWALRSMVKRETALIER